MTGVGRPSPSWNAAASSTPRSSRRSPRRSASQSPAGRPRHPAALLVADGEHRRHRAHARRAGAPGEVPAGRRSAAVGRARWPNGGEEHWRLPRFPREGDHRRGGRASTWRRRFAECDFLLHGSGPSLVAEKDVAALEQGDRQALRRVRHHVIGSFSPAERHTDLPAAGPVRRSSATRCRSSSRRRRAARARSWSSARMGRSPRDLRDDASGHGFPQGKRAGGGQIPLLHSAPALHALLDDSARSMPRSTRSSTRATRR